MNCFGDGFEKVLYDVDGKTKFVKYLFVEVCLLIYFYFKCYLNRIKIILNLNSGFVFKATGIVTYVTWHVMLVHCGAPSFFVANDSAVPKNVAYFKSGQN